MWDLGLSGDYINFELIELVSFSYKFIFFLTNIYNSSILHLLVITTRGSDYMSNQKIDLTVLSILAEYVNGTRPLNYDEIQGTMRIAKRLKNGEDISLSLLSDTVEAKSSTDSFSQNESEISHPNTEVDSEVDSEVDVSEYIENTSRTQITLSPAKTRRPRNVWSDKFINDFKPEVLTFIEKKGFVKQETLFNFFELHFKDRLNSEDLKKSGKNGRPRWQLKLHDNISVWFVKPGIVKFSNSIYAYNEQKTLNL